MHSLRVGVILVTLLVSGVIASAQPFTVNLRSRVQPFKSLDQWSEVAITKELNPKETAIILCDVWDKHWCEMASQRCGVIAERMEPVLKQARARGFTIIHAPSECMGFYKDQPQRQRMEQITKVTPPKA